MPFYWGAYMDNVEIIPACECHMDSVSKIAIDAWTPIREEFKKLLGEEVYNSQFTDWQSKKTESVKKQLLSGKGYVAIMNNKVAGFISYMIHADTNTGEILANAVSVDARGMGIGSKMYDFVTDKMKAEGAEFVTVHTGLDDAHAPARRAYEKAGFSASLPSIQYYKKL